MNTEKSFLSQRLKSAQKELTSIAKQLAKAPVGSLNIRKGNHSYKYLHVISEHNVVRRSYIRKGNHALAKALAQKRYLKLRQKELQEECSLINLKLQGMERVKFSSEELLYKPGYRELLLPIYRPEQERALHWLQETYEKNESFPEYLKFKTTTGITVRSKSESMIVQCLEKHHIPFRYECALELDGHIVYPDFTIYQPIKNREIYWEHFGRADDPEYRENLTFKTNQFLKHQLIPNDNLILTYETKEHPITEELIDRIIRSYVLEA